MKKSTAAPSSSSGRQLLQREAVNLFGIGKKANFGHLLAYQTKNGGNSYLKLIDTTAPDGDMKSRLSIAIETIPALLMKVNLWRLMLDNWKKGIRECQDRCTDTKPSADMLKFCTEQEFLIDSVTNYRHGDIVLRHEQFSTAGLTDYTATLSLIRTDRSKNNNALLRSPIPCLYLGKYVGSPTFEMGLTFQSPDDFTNLISALTKFNPEQLPARALNHQEQPQTGSGYSVTSTSTKAENGEYGKCYDISSNSSISPSDSSDSEIECDVETVVKTLKTRARTPPKLRLQQKQAAAAKKPGGVSKN